MADKFVSRGFKGRARETERALNERIPPGQYETKDFPVLSAGPTPRTSLERWSFSIYGEIAENFFVCEKGHGCAPLPIDDQKIAEFQKADARCAKK